MVAAVTMVPEEGLEPSRTRVRQILSLLRLPLRHSGGAAVERAKGIEPSSSAWKADALPLSYARMGKTAYSISELPCVVNAKVSRYDVC